MCKLARLFDPSHAVAHLTPALVDELVASVKPIAEHIDLEKLKGELDGYLNSSKDFVCLHDDVAKFTAVVFAFWKHDAAKAKLSELRKAARITFAMMTLNSAACERVFSLLKVMYGDQQMNALADLEIQRSVSTRLSFVM